MAMRVSVAIRGSVCSNQRECEECWFLSSILIISVDQFVLPKFFRKDFFIVVFAEENI